MPLKLMYHLLLVVGVKSWVDSTCVLIDWQSYGEFVAQRWHWMTAAWRTAMCVGVYHGSRCLSDRLLGGNSLHSKGKQEIGGWNKKKLEKFPTGLQFSPMQVEGESEFSSLRFGRQFCILNSWQHFIVVWIRQENNSAFPSSLAEAWSPLVWADCLDHPSMLLSTPF